MDLSDGALRERAYQECSIPLTRPGRHDLMCDLCMEQGNRYVALRDAARADVKGQRDELARQLKSAVTVLARHGFCEHAGTWISREEADRISKDGP